MSTLSTEVDKRRAFAIISHPDAGKTTLTEKMLLYGGAIHLAGSVKARRAARHATSDWMELERQRGISITSSVLQFEYQGLKINLLDTPGHRDFSEDTYRTLAAADAAVMLIDCAKGVEDQTRKLFEVCKLRGIPIFTFVNKMDRNGRPPLEIMEEIEEVLGIRSTPINWPVGMGNNFKGVYQRSSRSVALYESDASHGGEAIEATEISIDDPDLVNHIGQKALDELLEEVELLDVAGDQFNLEKVLEGQLTPTFFGSALNNFGVQLFLNEFIKIAPTPLARVSTQGVLEPHDALFSGFVFKIQANMNPSHRDRIAFVRICSGKFKAGMNVFHDRLERMIQLKDAHQFMAQDRSHVQEAYAGDIVGLYDTGLFRIGDTIVGKPQKGFHYNELRRFSPEFFARVSVAKALKRKQLEKGLKHLSEEGAIQIFRAADSLDVDPVVGAVGVLQFEVLQYRMKAEYNVDIQLFNLPFKCARWIQGEGFVPEKFNRRESTHCVLDQDGKPLLLLRNEWALQWVKQDYPKVQFFAYAPDGKDVIADA